MGGTITWWKIALLSIQINDLLLNGINVGGKDWFLGEEDQEFCIILPIFDSPCSSGVKAIYCTLDYYMFKTSKDAVSYATVTRAQSVPQAMPSTIWKSMESFQARNNGLADHIGHAHLPLSFGLADAVQSISRRHLHVDASDLLTDVMYTLASKMLHTPLFTAIEWSSFGIQPTKVFYLASRILEEKTTLDLLTVAESTVDTSTTEDPKETPR